MEERDGSSSLVPWYSLYRDFRYTVVFGIRGCSLYRDVRHSVVFFYTVVLVHCGILYTGVFVILLYSL